MKNLIRIFFLISVLMLVSCNSDDDICTSGEATPRLKMKFKDSNNKIVRLDSLYIDVDYGSGKKAVFTGAKVDSVLLPLRVDESGFTEFYVRRLKKGATSKVKMTYTTKSQYVSPACGIKKTYENVASQLVTPNPVTALEQNQTQIVNEGKTNLYLIF